MNKPNPFTSDLPIQQLLDAVQTGLLLCEEDGRPIFTNRLARVFLERAGLLSSAQSCYRLLFGNDTPCEDCPQSSSADRRHALALKGPEGDIYLKVYCQAWLGCHLLTIHDVTQEISLLRRTDLDKKELQAKNILLERRRRLNLIEQDFLGQLMNNLPDALVVVDDAFQIQRENTEAEKLFPSKKNQCFSLLGHSAPCPGCPAQYGFSLVDGKKKSHEVNGLIFTEIFSPGPNGRGGLLLFRDITRQVGLIGQIREQQDEIAQKNQLLSLLVDFGTFLQKENDGREVAEHFLNAILPVLHHGAAVLIVSDIRPGNLWLTRQRGTSEEALDLTGKACLSREFLQNKSDGLVPTAALPWPEASQIPLVGTKGQQVGLIALEGCLGGEERDMLRLVIEPLGAYFQNQLLLSQLEEKANTDGLTGLYNRSYLNQAIEEEQAKFVHYGIHYAVIVADVNQLKKLNDEHGHEAGDLMIITVAKALQKSLRPTDIAARTGGDEFVLLMAGCTEIDAGRFIERLQQQVLADLSIPVAQGTRFPVTLSLGWASSDMLHKDSPGSADTLLKEADRRMYANKQNFYHEKERYR